MKIKTIYKIFCITSSSYPYHRWQMHKVKETKASYTPICMDGNIA